MLTALRHPGSTGQQRRRAGFRSPEAFLYRLREARGCLYPLAGYGSERRQDAEAEALTLASGHAV